MKVYVVVYDYFELLEVLGVFTDEHEAVKLAATGSSYYILESTLDPKSP
jgi:hypothetical protein